MPKLKPETEHARRQNILDAAQRCFARRGFHGTSMQDICKEAMVSPGALYVYFDSKEALIAGLCERDRAELTERLEGLSQAPDFLAALSAIGESYFVDDPADNRRVAVEMGLESTRNARVADIFLGADRFCGDAFESMFQRLKDEGRINPTLDIPTLTKVFLVIGDGLFWRRAVVPDYDVREVLPVLTAMIGALVRPVEAPAETLEETH
ncbi:MAG: TetR/AcrR family transcriptional regulator [Hyphomicrobiaceae bacterium]|nr:TetR/AcrR family transcriptional regulator [Hyphomicrobiaceae bacterium]